MWEETLRRKEVQTWCWSCKLQPGGRVRKVGVGCCREHRDKTAGLQGSGLRTRVSVFSCDQSEAGAAPSPKWSRSHNFSFSGKCHRNAKCLLPSTPRPLIPRLQLGVSAPEGAPEWRMGSSLAVSVGVSGGRAS